jgi:hypothetical protein
VVQECGDHDRRHRAHASHPQGAVRTGASRRSRPSCACSLERGAWGLKSARRRRERLLVTAICTRAIATGGFAVIRVEQWQGEDLYVIGSRSSRSAGTKTSDRLDEPDDPANGADRRSQISLESAGQEPRRGSRRSLNARLGRPWARSRRNDARHRLLDAFPASCGKFRTAACLDSLRTMHKTWWSRGGSNP